MEHCGVLSLAGAKWKRNRLDNGLPRYRKLASGSGGSRVRDSVLEKPYGDRRQEIVIIGFSNQMEEEWVRARLDLCLLDDEEMAAGPEAWRHLEDPFVSWEPAFA